MDPSNQLVLRSPRKMAKSALLLAALAAPSGALVAPGPRATRGSALAHHKQRSAVEDLKIYRRMKSWETNEEIVDEAAIDEYERSLRSYKPKVVTYGETRKEGNGLDLPLPLPAVFAAVGVAAVAASVAVSGGLGPGALVGTPGILGAAIFALNQLDPVPLAVEGLSVDEWETRATPTMRVVKDDVCKTRYFEDTWFLEALVELRLAGLGMDAPELRRVELFDDGDDDVSLSLVFHSADVPFKTWIELAQKGRLDSFFDGASCSVTKVDPAQKLVSIDISSAVFEDEVVAPAAAAPVAAEHSHAHDHDHAPHAAEHSHEPHAHDHAPEAAAAPKDAEVFAR